jgi:plasmid stability protein
LAKTVTIRDLDDETYQGLSRRAAELGVSVPEFLRRVAKRIAHQPSMVEWLARTELRSGRVRGTDVLVGLDELRGDWTHSP